MRLCSSPVIILLDRQLKYLYAMYIFLQIPKYLIDLYEAQTGNKLKTSNLHLPGRYTKTANTVRTFYHDRK